MLSFSSNRSRALVALLFALCLVSQARAQDSAAQKQEDEDVVRINTELVQTDVMVFGKDGKFVENLKPEQFELKVDGRAQQIVFFDKVKAGTADEDAQLAAARGVKGASSGAALPLDRGRTVIFYVDDLHLSATSALNIRKTLLRFIDEEIGQNDEAAIMSATGQIGFLQQFTDNKAVLRAAASRINARPGGLRDGQTPVMSESHALAIERNDQSVSDFFIDALLRENPMLRREMADQMVRSRASSILQQADSIALNTLYSLESVVHGSAPLPGRKVLFFISDGFLIDDSNTSMRDRMHRIADAAARSGVVIYSLDAQGLRTGQPDASAQTNFDPSGRLSQTDMGEISDMQSPLFTLADETGGRALVNSNAIGHSVSGALKETALYYLLAWKPQATGQSGTPKFQRIEVSVKDRPDLRVIVRRGFFNAQPPESKEASSKKKKGGELSEPQKTAGQELVDALRSPLPREGLPTTLSLGYVHPQQGGALLTTSVELDRSSLTFEQGEKPRADFEIVGVVVDDRGRTVSKFGQSLTVTINPNAPDTKEHVVYSFQLPLAQGLYQVRVAARDQRSGHTGSAMQWVEVPDFQQGRISLSSIFLGERTTAAGAAQGKPNEGPQSVMLSVERRFARTSWIRFLTFVYNAAQPASAQPDVALQVQVFRDDQPVFTAPLSKLRTEGVSDTTRIPYMAEMSLASLPTGRYVMQITAIDRSAKTSTSQRANFIIE